MYFSLVEGSMSQMIDIPTRVLLLAWTYALRSW